jgi:lysophospholipase L1-like esterase
MAEVDTRPITVRPPSELPVGPGQNGIDKVGAGRAGYFNGVPEALLFHSVMAGEPINVAASSGQGPHFDAPDLPPGSQPHTFDTTKIQELTCPETPNQSPDRFNNLIAQFDASDKAQNIGHVPTVIFGSSTIANWKDLESTFSDLGAINRGMGGSTLPDLDKFVGDLVLKHTPDRVILYAGTNDLAEGHDSERAFEDFRALEQRIHGTSTTEPNLPGASPDIKVYVIGMIPAPCREVLEDKYHLYDAANEKISEYASRTPNTYFIDPSRAVDDSSGHLDSARFLSDHLHPTAEVYTALAGIIRQNITADEIGVP